jgi:hypothetical protein
MCIKIPLILEYEKSWQTTIWYAAYLSVTLCSQNKFLFYNLPLLFHKKLNSVVLVRMRTIPTERPQPVGEVSANSSWYRVPRGQRNESPRP